MRMLLLPMMPQFPWAGSASRPDPRGDLTGCSIRSFPHSSSKQISASRVLCLAFSGLWGYRRIREEGNCWSRGSLCPILSSCDWPFTASWEPLPRIFTGEQSLHHWFVHFMLASNTHLGEALEIQVWRMQSPCPPEAHILVKERDGELTTLGQAVKKKKKTITRERLFWTRWSGNVSWWRPCLSRDLKEACGHEVKEHGS